MLASPRGKSTILHAPPGGVELNVVVNPAHTLKPGLAVIGVGIGFTVTPMVVKQPSLKV